MEVNQVRRAGRLLNPNGLPEARSGPAQRNSLGWEDGDGYLGVPPTADFAHEWGLAEQYAVD